MAASPAAAAAGSYVPLAPARLADTRPGATTVDGQAAGGGAIGEGGTLDLAVLGRGGVPASGVDAVVVNVTVTLPTKSGFLTVFPTGQPVPLASNLNFTAGKTVPNLVIAKVGAGGKISFFNPLGATHVVVDVMGVFPTGGDFTGLIPARLADGRPGATTTDTQFAGTGPIGEGGTLDLTVVNRGGVPATGVDSVVLNVTVTQPTKSGFLTVFPTGQVPPAASNLNFIAGQTVPNLVIAKVGSGGKVSLFNPAGNTFAVVDVMGWFPTGGEFTALAPTRLADTRPGFSTFDGRGAGTGAIFGGDHLIVSVLGRGGVPTDGVGAVALNVTVTQPTAAGFVTAYPGWDARPLASNLNFVPGQTVPNLVIVKVGPGGKVDLYNPFGTVQLVVDVVGWFPGTTDAMEPTPQFVSATGDHGCALITNGRVQCWGDNFFGQLGNGSTSQTGVPVPDTVLGIDNAIAVSSGFTSSCALLSGGQVKCWGDNSDKQLGVNAPSASAVPVTVADVAGATAVSVGVEYACAVISGGTVKCWGGATFGQLGSGSSTLLASTAIPVAGIANAVSVSAGFLHACALLSDGTAKCWGDNEFGQLGNNATSDVGVFSPVVVSGLTGATQISAGFDQSCAVLSGGAVKCWGDNENGQVGSPTFGPFALVPAAVTGLSSGVTKVVAGVGASCAIRGDESVSCWGNGSTDVVTLSGPGTAADMAVGNGFFIIRFPSGAVVGLGENSFGELGDGTFDFSFGPSTTHIRA